LVRRIHDDHADIFSTHTLVLESAECHITGDRHKLERVVVNLLTNAVKYSPEGSTVRVTVTPQRSHATFVVEDEGEGMSPDELAVIFQPFGRGREKNSRVKGAGLGMCVVKEVVKAHGGCIDVRSEPGGGTAVEVRLPLTETK